jgi:predicted small lipoprotein YifL
MKRKSTTSVAFAALATAALTLLAGCGQKGPLVLPAAPAASGASAPAR